MSGAGALVVAAVLAASLAGACSDPEPDEPAAAPVVCSSDAPFTIEDPTPSDAELDDMGAATGLDEDAAARRARMQDIAMSVRTELSEVDPGYLGLRIDDEGDGLVYLTTEPDLACRRLEAEMGGAADGIAVVTAARSRIDIDLFIATVMDELADLEAAGRVVVQRRIGDLGESMVLEVPHDRVDDVEDALDGLPEDVRDDVAVVGTDLVPIEGG